MKRRVELVTSTEVQGRLSDAVCTEVVAGMTAHFGNLTSPAASSPASTGSRPPSVHHQASPRQMSSQTSSGTSTLKPTHPARPPADDTGPEHRPAATPGLTRPPELPANGSPWHATPVVAAAEALGVDPASGLAEEDAERRLGEAGLNRLPETKARSTLAIFLDQFRNVLVLVLLAAAVVAGLLGDLKDTAVIAVVLLFNAVLGFAQEQRAERSLTALRAMLVPTARVRRSAGVREVKAESLVPGDIVLFEAGGRVPADGLLIAAHALEIDESTLTGESTAVSKNVGASDLDTIVAERRGSAFTNTTVTRGRGELLVHGTGPRTEIGRLAGLLASAAPGPTPLQKQLDALGKRLVLVAGVAAVLFTTVSLLRGERPGDLVLKVVALAVAAIPEGLPAVVTLILAAGSSQLAKRGAIVKAPRLGRNPRRHLSDLFGQDRHPHLQPDDRPTPSCPRPPIRRHG